MTQKHRIQKAINFGVRIVTGLARRDHVSPALESLGWKRFDKMLEERDVALIGRLVSQDPPPALAHAVKRRSDVSSRRTRGTCKGQLELPKVRTERARRSFPYRAIYTWNSRARQR